MAMAAEFLPVSRAEMTALGWDECDVIIVTGDAYVDHPSFGAALIGRYLESLGYRVGIIPQPDVDSPDDLLVMGRPRLFVGVTSGAMDSMVNHYTSLGRIRSNDAYSQGGIPGKRPDRALLRYVNMVQRTMPGIPVIAGGIEASLRRLSHFDFWSGRIRKSVILDSKADILVYGMGERQIGEIACAISHGLDARGIRGTGFSASWKSFSSSPLGNFVELPSHEELTEDPAALVRMTALLEQESSPWSGSRLIQRADERVVVINPPAYPLSTREMDSVYDLPYARRPHPMYTAEIPAFRMICNSVTAVRGCSGGCSFCAIGLHQGRFISSRSRESVLKEIEVLTGKDHFKGTVTDIGGPTANLYGLGCRGGMQMKKCSRYSCLYPEICSNFNTDHSGYVELLEAAANVPGVRNVFVSSGIRFDVALRDMNFIRKLCRDNVPGYLKIAPEHFHPEVLSLMRKPMPELWREFKALFDDISAEESREQYIQPYMMVAFPGCTMEHMRYAAKELKRQGMRPEKTQIFLPTPMTMATAMYFASIDPVTGESIYVADRPSRKRKQLDTIPGHTTGSRRRGLKKG